MRLKSRTFVKKNNESLVIRSGPFSSLCLKLRFWKQMIKNKQLWRPNRYASARRGDSLTFGRGVLMCLVVVLLLVLGRGRDYLGSDIFTFPKSFFQTEKGKPIIYSLFHGT